MDWILEQRKDIRRKIGEILIKFHSVVSSNLPILISYF